MESSAVKVLTTALSKARVTLSLHTRLSAERLHNLFPEISND